MSDKCRLLINRPGILEFFGVHEEPGDVMLEPGSARFLEETRVPGLKGIGVLLTFTVNERVDRDKLIRNIRDEMRKFLPV